MPQPIRLIAIDVDGTLLTSSGEVTPETISAVREVIAAGVEVVLASARVRVSMVEYAGAIGTQSPMICCDGAQIYRTPAGPLWHQFTIPDAVAADIVALSDERGWGLTITAGETTFLRAREGQTPGEYKPGRVIVAENQHALGHDPVSRIVTYDLEGMAFMDEHCHREYGDVIRTQLFALPGKPAHSLGIFPPDADKGSALKYIMEKLDISPEQTLAIGDGVNDPAMFRVAGVSVAMGNATDAVKAQAGHVAPDNDSGGVAWALRTLVV